MNTMPNFFIVGAARSGTTSLHHYLRQHSEIYMAPNKETHYFSANQFPSCFQGPGDNPRPLEKLIKSLVPSQLRTSWGAKTLEKIVKAVPIDSQTHAQLKEYFTEDVRKLEDLLHRDLSHWHTANSTDISNP